jgi:hypothetical protein
MITLLAVALLAAPVRAVTLESAFEEGARIAGPDAAAVEAALRGSDRAAARDAARSAGDMMGAFDDDGQRRVVLALRDAAESGFAAPEVRAEAVLQLGESALWIRDDGTKRLAAGELFDVMEAGSFDARASFRRLALKGLATTVHGLPQDMALETRAAQDLLAAVAASDAAERTLALTALRELIVSRPRVAQAQEDPTRRMESVVVEPILRDPAGFASGARADVSERWASYRALIALAWASDDMNARLNVKRIMDEASNTEADPALRQAVQAWSGALRPR